MDAALVLVTLGLYYLDDLLLGESFEAAEGLPCDGASEAAGLLVDDSADLGYYGSEAPS